MSLGTVPYRGQKYLGGKMKGPSRYNKKYPELYKSIRALISAAKPDFTYTTIQINENLESAPHFDKNNMGESYIIALGDFQGGELMVEGTPFNIRNRFKRFDGTKGHWTAPFEGERYSLVFFTHTFKPPIAALNGITVSEDGMFDKAGEPITLYRNN